MLQTIQYEFPISFPLLTDFLRSRKKDHLHWSTAYAPSSAQPKMVFLMLLKPFWPFPTDCYFHSRNDRKLTITISATLEKKKMKRKSSRDFNWGAWVAPKPWQRDSGSLPRQRTDAERLSWIWRSFCLITCSSSVSLLVIARSLFFFGTPVYLLHC